MLSKNRNNLFFYTDMIDNRTVNVENCMHISTEKYRKQSGEEFIQ